ncbi:MAG: hypothetical protein QNL78_06740 [Actinomycetes bacterium]
MNRMDGEDFWFRFRRGFHDLFYGERTSVRIFSRLVLLTFVAGFIATVAPTVADVLTQEDPGPVSTYVEPTPEPTPEQVESESPAPETSPEASEEAAPPTENPEPAPEYSVAQADSDTATVEPIIEADAPLSPQPKYTLKIPQTFAIDPRANSYFLPAIYLAGSKFSLVCINGNGINFDLSNKRISDDSSDTSTVMVLGDGSSNLRIAGRSEEVLSVINSGGGLFAYTNSGGLRDRIGSISVIATNEATIDSEFCGAATSGNSRTFIFRGLGLQVDIKKGSGRLK